MSCYSHLLKNFPHFVVIHTVKGFGIVNKAEVDVFLEISCFFDDPTDVGNLISGSSAFSKSSLNIGLKSVSPVLCKFWWLYGEVNGDLLQEGLCHTQVYCIQSPFPCSSPLLTHTSAEDTQTHFCLSLCGVSGSWCTQVLFEPSEHLWRVWGLI